MKSWKWQIAAGPGDFLPLLIGCVLLFLAVPPFATMLLVPMENPGVIGMPLFWGFKATSAPNTFESGQIYNGENGKIYSANISLQADGKLRLRGYVGSPMLGETQLWTRVSQ